MGAFGVGMATVLEIILKVLSAVSGIITILLFIIVKIKVDDIDYKGTLFVTLTNSKHKVRIILFAALVTAFLIILSVLLPQKKTPPHTSPTPTPPNPGTISPIPPNTDGLVRIPLTELKPIITDRSAFSFNNWDIYKTLAVDGDYFTNGIGVRIPLDIQKKIYEEHTYELEDYQVALEYKLCRKYERLTFSYGIDDSTYDAFDRDTPSGKCIILVQYKTSDKTLKEGENILYDSKEFYYSLTKRDVTIDVSEIEVLRFTFFWSYKPDPTEQNCFNLVIIDPVLYLKET